MLSLFRKGKEKYYVTKGEAVYCSACGELIDKPLALLWSGWWLDGRADHFLFHISNDSAKVISNKLSGVVVGNRISVLLVPVAPVGSELVVLNKPSLVPSNSHSDVFTAAVHNSGCVVDDRTVYSGKETWDGVLIGAPVVGGLLDAPLSDDVVDDLLLSSKLGRLPTSGEKEAFIERLSFEEGVGFVCPFRMRSPHPWHVLYKEAGGKGFFGRDEWNPLVVQRSVCVSFPEEFMGVAGSPCPYQNLCPSFQSHKDVVVPGYDLTVPENLSVVNQLLAASDVDRGLLFDGIREVFGD